MNGQTSVEICHIDGIPDIDLHEQEKKNYKKKYQFNTINVRCDAMEAHIKYIHGL